MSDSRQGVERARNVVETERSLARVLMACHCRNVAWRGEGGEFFYSQAENFSQSLADIIAPAQDDLTVLHLTMGWWKARLVKKQILRGDRLIDPEDDRTGTVVLVVDDLIPELIEALESYNSQCLDLTVVLTDSFARYLSGGTLQRPMPDWPGPYLESRGLICPPPISCFQEELLQETLLKLRSCRGISLLHVTNTPADSPATRQVAACGQVPTPAYPPPRGDLSFQESVWQRVRADVTTYEDVITMALPGAMPNYPCGDPRWLSAGVLSVVCQALSMARIGFHPLLLVSASDIPLLISDLRLLRKQPVTLVVTDAGLEPSSEAKRPCPEKIFDLSLLRTLSDVPICVPADEEEARGMLAYLLQSPNLGILRLTCSPAIGLPPSPQLKVIEPFRGRVLGQGSDLAFLCLGRPAYHATLAAEAISNWGLSVAIYDMRSLYPLDTQLLRQASACGRVITVEEHAPEGGLGSAVLEELNRHPARYLHDGHMPQVKVVGINPGLTGADLEEQTIAASCLVEAARQLINSLNSEVREEQL